MEITTVLQNVFGYDQFRHDQSEIIESVLDHQDVLVIMPTGGGKSICYQIPAIVSEGLTIVISPLIALMNDQVSAMRELDIKAVAIHSHNKAEQNHKIFEELNSGAIKLLYLSPEKILSENILLFLSRLDVKLIAIDEAHCVSVWGNDFRPEYVRLASLKQHFPKANTIALTATAGAATRKDIVHQLKLNDPGIFVSSFERKNISISVKSGIKRAEQILAFLYDKSTTSGIVYCLSRKSTEQVAARLRKNGYKAESYHAGLASEDRMRIQRDFQNDEVNVICATIAFGMGIDKPNIRWVIHYNMPKNLEGYYQEIGRAGRDGQPAEALLFYSWADFLNLQKFIESSEADETFRQVQRSKLSRMWEFASALSCRTNLVLSYFGEFKNEACAHCDNCLSPPALFDGTKFAQMALSAVVRAKESLGLNLLIDVLRGSNRYEIRDKRLHLIKTFGVGKSQSFVEWRHYITQMINQGILAIDFMDASRLKLTPLSTQVLRNQKSIKLGDYAPPKSKPKVVIQPKIIDVSDADQDLLAVLKTWRKDLADKNGIPLYLVLSNKALNQIASLKPQNKMQLLEVEGIGQIKQEKYGTAILEMVHKVSKDQNE